MSRRKPNPSGRPAEEAAPIQCRSLVLGDRRDVLGLTKAGVAATTFSDVLSADRDLVAGYFHDEPPAVLVVRDEGEAGQAAQAGERLASLGIPSMVVDRERLP